MHLGYWYVTLIDHPEWYAAECRDIGGLVPEWRTAQTTKSPKPTSRIELANARFGPSHDEMTRLNYAPRGVCCTGKLPARGAMAVPCTVDCSVNLERDFPTCATSFQHVVALPRRASQASSGIYRKVRFGGSSAAAKYRNTHSIRSPDDLIAEQPVSINGFCSRAA